MSVPFFHSDSVAVFRTRKDGAGAGAGHTEPHPPTLIEHKQLTESAEVKIEAIAAETATETVKRHTRIVCTIGPKTNTLPQLEKLLRAGMNIARLNFSHGTHESHGEVIKLLRQAMSNTGILCAIMLDTKGPEIRTGKLKNKSGVKIEEGQNFYFYTDGREGDETGVSLSYTTFTKKVKKGGIILVADGKFTFKILEIQDDKVLTQAITGGTLGETKNCNLPQVEVDLPTLGHRDEDDIKFGVEQGIDLIAASFIRTAQDVLHLRALPGVAENKIKIFSKIENQQGLDNFEAILQVTDGVMVARGDLGMEVPLEKVGVFQKQMIAKCNEAGKPVITATQMLESMIYNSRPTRAEVTDVLNAVLDGTDAVMLSGETANGDFPIEAVQTQSKICQAAEEVFDYNVFQERIRKSFRSTMPDVFQETIASLAVQAAEGVQASLICVITESGAMARRVSKYAPRCPILGVTWNEQVARQLLLSRGCLPFLVIRPPVDEKDLSRMVRKAIHWKIISAGQKIVLVFGKTGIHNIHNSLRLVEALDSDSLIS